MNRKKLKETLRHVSGPTPDKPRRPKYKGTFAPGIAGITGETYWTIGVQEGTRISIVKDPRDGSHPVFTKSEIAEQVVANLEKMRIDDKNMFPTVTCFLVSKLEVGKPSQILRPSAGNIQIPNLSEVMKYGGNK